MRVRPPLIRSYARLVFGSQQSESPIALLSARHPLDHGLPSTEMLRLQMDDRFRALPWLPVHPARRR
jgi:hypothetical protein